MLKICIKDLKLFFSDRRGVIISFILPIALISLFAFAFGGMGGNGKGVPPIPLPVCYFDSTENVEGIISNLDSITEIKIERIDFEIAKEQVIKGDRIACLVFYKGFADSLENGGELPMELMYDEAKQVEMGLLQSVLIRNLMQNIGSKRIKQDIRRRITEQYTNLSNGELDNIMNDINSQFDSDDGGIGSNMSLTTTSIVGEKKEANLGLIQAVSGVAILMLLFSVAGLGAGLLEEKESGTLKKLLYSPVKKIFILYGKMLAGFTVSIIQLVIMFVFTWLAFGLNIFLDLPSLLIMILSTAFACSSFGIFLASIAKTRQQVQGLSMIIILVMSAIGGSMIPLFIMPEIMQKIAVISVNYWAIQGFYDIFWRELPILDILQRASFLIGIGAIVSFISIILFKKNIVKIT